MGVPAPPVPVPGVPIPPSSGLIFDALRRSMDDSPTPAAEFGPYFQQVSDDNANTDEIAEAWIAGTKLCLFLTLLDGEVTILHTASKFKNGIGQPARDNIHNKEFVVAGDLVSDQMVIWRAPATGLTEWVGTKRVIVPTDAQIAALVAGALQAHTATTAAQPGDPLPKLIMAPTRWAVHFMDRLSPTECLDKMASPNSKSCTYCGTFIATQGNSSLPSHPWERMTTPCQNLIWLSQPDCS